MKIILDAMGGDNAPQAPVEGAVLAAQQYGCNIILVGRQEELEPALAGRCRDRITVHHASEVITMEDKYSPAFRAKKDSSMTVGLELLNRGEGDVLISAGSTGALLTGATLLVKRVKGIRRAAMAPVLPNGGKGLVLILRRKCGVHTGIFAPVRIYGKLLFRPDFGRQQSACGTAEQRQ